MAPTLYDEMKDAAKLSSLAGNAPRWLGISGHDRLNVDEMEAPIATDGAISPGLLKIVHAPRPGCPGCLAPPPHPHARAWKFRNKTHGMDREEPRQRSRGERMHVRG